MIKKYIQFISESIDSNKILGVEDIKYYLQVLVDDGSINYSIDFMFEDGEGGIAELSVDFLESHPEYISDVLGYYVTIYSNLFSAKEFKSQMKVLINNLKIDFPNSVCDYTHMHGKNYRLIICNDSDLSKRLFP